MIKLVVIAIMVCCLSLAAEAQHHSFRGLAGTAMPRGSEPPSADSSGDSGDSNSNDGMADRELKKKGRGKAKGKARMRKGNRNSNGAGGKKRGKAVELPGGFLDTAMPRGSRPPSADSSDDSGDSNSNDGMADRKLKKKGRGKAKGKASMRKGNGNSNGAGGKKKGRAGELPGEFPGSGMPRGSQPPSPDSSDDSGDSNSFDDSGDSNSNDGEFTGSSIPGSTEPPRVLFDRPETIELSCVEPTGPVCSFNRKGDEGIWVCRSFFSPWTGEKTELSTCVDPTAAISTDACGCCSGSCPTSCACACETDKGEEGFLINAGTGAEAIGEQCVPQAIANSLVTSQNEFTCVTICTN